MAQPHGPVIGRANNEIELVDYANRAAEAAPGTPPAPHDWVFVQTEYAGSTSGQGGLLFGPPNERFVDLSWFRADGDERADLVTSQPIAANAQADTQVQGHLVTSSTEDASYGDWKSVSYTYLASLPTDPLKLELVILANDRPGPFYISSPDVAVYEAISTLLIGQTSGIVVPPKLAAAMYQVLETLPGVHFESATDLAGATGLGFYMVMAGWYKQELVIDPDTYTLMGYKSVAITNHTESGTDGTRHVQAGQVLGWKALLNESVVGQPGQLP